MRSALEIWRYCYDSARYIFGDSLGDSTADAILAALKAADNGLTRTEIRDLFGRNKPAADITRALSMLAEYGKAVRGEPTRTYCRPTCKLRQERQQRPLFTEPLNFDDSDL